MGQTPPELPAEHLVSAVDNARRGVVTHITIKGERAAAIVSESTLAMSQLLAALLTSEMAASALPAVLPAAFPWASSIPEDELMTFAGEFREAVVAYEKAMRDLRGSCTSLMGSYNYWLFDKDRTGPCGLGGPDVADPPSDH